jgi:hemolysin III
MVFGLTMALMLAASALYHALRVEDQTLAWLRRLDHAAIFLFHRRELHALPDGRSGGGT